MADSSRLHLRALVPECVFEGRGALELEAVFHPETGVLNVLTPGAPHKGSGVVSCPVHDGAANLPTWAKDLLASAPAQMSRLELLQHIISTTHAALDEIEGGGRSDAVERGEAQPGVAALAAQGEVQSVAGAPAAQAAEQPDVGSSMAQDGTQGAPARQGVHQPIAAASATQGAPQPIDGEPAQPQISANPHAAGEADAPDSAPASETATRFCILREEGSVRVLSDAGEFEVERYELSRSVFSRNTGILETDVMADKRAVILGCGSVGSLVAVELARAGVGGFLLVDMDLVEYHNVCRHRCGISDVGRRKPDAVADLVRNINPAARVETCYVEIQQAPRDMLEEWCVPGETVVFGCADTREVDVYANDFAADFGAAFVSIGFWERAFAGEVFYWIPGQGHACYRCALAGDAGLSQRVEANHHIYTSQTDLAQVNFEPGIAVDIDFVTLVGVKLGLDIFNRGDARFTQRLLPHLTQYTLVCNTNDPAVGGPMAQIFSYPLQVTTSLQVQRGPSCPVCGTQG